MSEAMATAIATNSYTGVTKWIQIDFIVNIAGHFLLRFVNVWQKISLTSGITLSDQFIDKVHSLITIEIKLR